MSSYQSYILIPSQIDEEYSQVYSTLFLNNEEQQSNLDTQDKWVNGQKYSQDIRCERDFFFSDPQNYDKPFAKKEKIACEKTSSTLLSINPLNNHSGLQNVQKAYNLKPQNIEKEDESDSQSEEGKQSNSKASKTIRKRNKNKKGKRQQYPTKNFLPSFRSSFINYLATHFDHDYFTNLQIIRRIRGKPCINLKDYKDLFRVTQFRPILKVYFKDRVIVRDLMQTRIDYEIKLIYLKKIHVFEEAFESGVFQKIN